MNNKITLDESQFVELPKNFFKTKGGQVISEINLAKMKDFKDLCFTIREVNDGKGLNKTQMMKIVRSHLIDHLLTMQPDEYELVIGDILDNVGKVYKGRVLFTTGFDEFELKDNGQLTKFDILDYEKKNLGIYLTYDPTKELKGLQTFQTVEVNKKWEEKEFYGVITSIKYQVNKFGGHPEIELYISDGETEIKTAINRTKNDLYVEENMQHRVVLITAGILDDVIEQEDETTGEVVAVSKRKISLKRVDEIAEMTFVATDYDNYQVLVENLAKDEEIHKATPTNTMQQVRIIYDDEYAIFKINMNEAMMEAIKRRCIN